MRRKGPQLFVYKHYARQEALDVADAKFRQLLDILVNPTPENQESFAVASKVLIKVCSKLFQFHFLFSLLWMYHRSLFSRS